MHRDGRPPLEQVKSGLRLASKMLAAFGTVLLFANGCSRIQAMELPHYPFIGIIMVALSIGIMIVTVRYWAEWFSALCAYGALRLLTRGLLFASAYHVSTLSVACLLAGLLVMALLTYRFTSKRYVMTQLDKATLVISTVCMLTSLLFSESSRSVAVFSVGGLCLLVSWLAYSARKHNYRKSHRSPALPI